MDDQGMSGAQVREVERLVRLLLGSDAAACGEAHAALEALGGFDRPEIHDALVRLAAQPLAASEPEPWQPPGLPGHAAARVIGTFELGRCLGQGGLGAVYEARDLSGAADRVPLCIKLAEPASAAAVQALARAGRLAAEPWQWSDGGWTARPASRELAAQVLESEYACLRDGATDLFPEVVAAGLWDDTAFYVMERLRGDDLRQKILSGEAAALDHRRLVRRLLRELAALRSRDERFFHGDLKPENLVVTPGRLRLIDPACRQETAQPGAPPLLTTGTVAYNPLGRTGAAADTSALALVLLELMTGLQPFARRVRPWRVGDGPQEAALLPLQAFNAAAERDPLVAKLVQFVRVPPDDASFAAVLG